MLLKISAGFLPYLAVFLSSLFHPADPDLGWYLKYGLYFFDKHEILKENIFSSQMANFSWVNHSWGTDLISYLTFDSFGFLGLSILGALIITATFYFFAKATRLDNFEKALIFPFIIYFLSSMNSVSFRGQLLSLMFLGILFYILTVTTSRHSREGENQIPNQVEDDRFKLVGSLKPIYLLPLLFILWSNLHGQFILGLAVFALFLGANFISQLLEKDHKNIIAILKENVGLIATFWLSVFAVLINPFGIGVYMESIKHFNNPLSKNIVEWVGTQTLSTLWWHQVLVGIAMFFGLIYLVASQKFKNFLPEVLITSLLYLISFSVRRFAWPMYYFSISLLKPLAAYFKPESRKYQQVSAAVIFILYILGMFFIDNPIKRISNMSWQSYCKKYIHCSDGALNYLATLCHSDSPSVTLNVSEESQNPSSRFFAPQSGTQNDDRCGSSNLLTYYGWGGYMIWQYPQVKPSIDGRMTLWRDEKGYSAFEDYYAYEQNTADIENSAYDIVLMYNQKPLYQHLEKLVSENKWQKVYEDKNAGVFVRN